MDGSARSLVTGSLLAALAAVVLSVGTCFLPPAHSAPDGRSPSVSVVDHDRPVTERSGR